MTRYDATRTWDHSTREQRRQRPHQITERGDTDPVTGKLINPNGVVGVRYLSEVHRLAEKGTLGPEHVHAADDWERLCRAVYGSPAQRSCLDTTPRGHDEPDEDGADQDREDFHAICKRVGRWEAAEMMRVIYQHAPCTRWDLLRAGLDKVAEFYGRKK